MIRTVIDPMTAPYIVPGDGSPAYIRRWSDEQTGREVRLLTRPGDKSPVHVPYFMNWKHMADGRMLCGRHIFDWRTGEVTELVDRGHLMHLSADGTRVYFYRKRERKVIALTLPDMREVSIGRLPRKCVFDQGFLTCDGRRLIGRTHEELGGEIAPFGQPDPAKLWQFFDRPRNGVLWSLEFATGKVTELARAEGHSIIYQVPSPNDPTMVKFCHDRHEAECQRIWTVRTDGTETRKIRPQAYGEVVTHDVWSPDGRYIAYKYLDRRHDATLRAVPWSEYAPVPTHIGLSTPDGEDVFFSDPLETYHSHVNLSRDSRLICGEGTHDHSCVYVAELSLDSTKLHFVPQATIHTHYSPMGGQGVNADFTPDGRWLLYNDTIAGEMHVCAVRIDL